jgi:hypothetical protein
VTRLRALGATALCAAGALAIGAGSRARFEIEPRGDAAIRLSWRAVSRPVEQCRVASAEELAQLPVHMRRSEICERRLPAFHLAVTLDGALVIDERIAPEGAQHDRPAYVLRELRVVPGTHRLSVRFRSEDAVAAPPLALEAELDLTAREVALVTEDPQRAGLEIRRGSAPGAPTSE